MQGARKAVRAPIADAMSSAVNPSWLSLASTLAPAAISSTAHASSPWELARISAVIPSISSWTGPYSAQLPAIRVPATPPALSPPPTPPDAGEDATACGPPAAAEAFVALSPQLRSMCASMMYDSATRPSNTAASSASAQTKPCASTHSRGMKLRELSAKRDLRNRRARK